MKILFKPSIDKIITIVKNDFIYDLKQLILIIINI